MAAPHHTYEALTLDDYRALEAAGKLTRPTTRVQITCKAEGAPRSRTFYGEMAWADAARYIDDFKNWLHRQRVHGRLWCPPPVKT